MRKKMSRNEIADMIDPRRAQLAIVDILASAGSELDWDSSLVEEVISCALWATDGLELPSSVDSSEDGAVEFWQAAK